MTGKKENNTTPAFNSSNVQHTASYKNFPVSIGDHGKKFLPKPAVNIHALRNLPDIPVHLTGRAKTTLQELLQFAKPLDIVNPVKTRSKTLHDLGHKTVLARKLSNIFRNQKRRRLHG